MQGSNGRKGWKSRYSLVRSVAVPSPVVHTAVFLEVFPQARAGLGKLWYDAVRRSMGFAMSGEGADGDVNGSRGRRWGGMGWRASADESMYSAEALPGHDHWYSVQAREPLLPAALRKSSVEHAGSAGMPRQPYLSRRWWGRAREASIAPACGLQVNHAAERLLIF